MNLLRDREHRTLLTVLKKARINAGLRQVDLAKLLNVPQSMISKYEVGERRLDILEIRKICSAFDLTLYEFVQLLETELSVDSNEAD